MPPLAGRGGVGGGIVEVDFFDEPDGEMIVGKLDMLGRADARAAVLAHQPRGPRTPARFTSKSTGEADKRTNLMVRKLIVNDETLRSAARRTGSILVHWGRTLTPPFTRAASSPT
jgi:hypothetical protein